MYVLFDVGVSQTRVAVSTDGRTLQAPRIVPTPPEPVAIAELIVQLGKELGGGEVLQAVSGGVTRKLLAVVPALEALCACPMYINNDTALVGLGEAVAGAGQGSAILAYLTVSSGVGGVRIVNKTIDQVAIGFEPGHQIINYDGQPATLEALVSGVAIAAERGQPPASIANEQFWIEKSKLLAVGVYNTILHWSPDTMVLGGSMMKQPGLQLAVLEAEVKRLNTVLPSLPRFTLGTLGDFGGLHGALAQLSNVGLVS